MVGAGLVHIRQPILNFGTYNKMSYCKIKSHINADIHSMNRIAGTFGNGGVKQAGEIRTGMYRQTGLLRKSE